MESISVFAQNEEPKIRSQHPEWSDEEVRAQIVSEFCNKKLTQIAMSRKQPFKKIPQSFGAKKASNPEPQADRDAFITNSSFIERVKKEDSNITTAAQAIQEISKKIRYLDQEGRIQYLHSRPTQNAPFGRQRFNQTNESTVMVKLENGKLTSLKNYKLLQKRFGNIGTAVRV